MSCVTLILRLACDTVPNHNPGLVSVMLALGMAIPSRHHDNWAGGLLELESQCRVASMPGFNSTGSTVILTVSGATVKNYKIKLMMNVTWKGAQLLGGSIQRQRGKVIHWLDAWETRQLDGWSNTKRPGQTMARLINKVTAGSCKILNKKKSLLFLAVCSNLPASNQPTLWRIKDQFTPR